MNVVPFPTADREPVKAVGALDCPICKAQPSVVPRNDAGYYAEVECARCGASAEFAGLLIEDTEERAIVAAIVRWNELVGHVTGRGPSPEIFDETTGVMVPF